MSARGTGLVYSPDVDVTVSRRERVESVHISDKSRKSVAQRDKVFGRLFYDCAIRFRASCADL